MIGLLFVTASAGIVDEGLVSVCKSGDRKDDIAAKSFKSSNGLQTGMNACWNPLASVDQTILDGVFVSIFHKKASL